MLPKTKSLGYHYIWDLSGCPSDSISKLSSLKAFANDLVSSLNLTVVGESGNQFSPHGATCVILLAESHLSVHSWPEENYLAIDLFSCMKIESIEVFDKIVQSHFGESLKIETQFLERGL